MSDLSINDEKNLHYLQIFFDNFEVDLQDIINRYSILVKVDPKFGKRLSKDVKEILKNIKKTKNQLSFKMNFNN